MKNFLFVFAAAFSCILAGCGTGDTRIIINRSDSVKFRLPPELAAVRHTPVTPFDIDVLDSSASNHAYVVVGLAEAETTTLAAAVTLLRTEASKIGGDALLDVLPAPGGNSSMGVPVLGDLTFRSGRIWTARVVRWLPDAKGGAGGK